MSDVFISYARADQSSAEALRDLLDKEGWDVWWDQSLYAGARWEAAILAALAEAKVVVVIWSKRSVASEWVKREVAAAFEAGKLVPCSIDGTLPAAPFDEIEVAVMPGWPGRPTAELPVLFAGLERHAKASRIDSVRPGYEIGFLQTDVDLPEL